MFKKTIKLLESLGFSLLHKSGTHYIYVNSDNDMCPVPLYGSENMFKVINRRITKRDFRKYTTSNVIRTKGG